MLNTLEPCFENSFLAEHAALMISSFRRLTGKDLVPVKEPSLVMYQSLFESPYCIVSHNTNKEPIFNYGNQTALKLFEMNWSAFTKLESKESAEPVNREERERLLARVTEDGFVDDYRGVRISATGLRFFVEDAVVWNLIDQNGLYKGQAAVLYKWSPL